MNIDFADEGVYGCGDFASLTQSRRAEDDETYPEVKFTAKNRRHTKKDRSSIKVETLTPEEEALRKQIKAEKKRSKLRQKYEMESLREMYEALQDENDFLKHIIRTHITPSVVANQIIAESEALRAAFFDTSKEQLKAHLDGSFENSAVDDGATIIASGNAIRRKSLDLERDAETAAAAASAVKALIDLNLEDPDK